MPVTVVRLSGLESEAALAAASAVIDDIRIYPDVRAMLVLDDTRSLFSHLRAYEKLRAQMRVEQLLCVASGPRPVDGTDGSGQVFRLPGNLRQGTGILWVSDPDGVNWRLHPGATIVGHSLAEKNGLDHLISLLSVDTIFSKVFQAMERVPGGVASPGLRLSGTDSEAESFAAALVLAIERMAVSGDNSLTSSGGPFGALLTAVTNGAGLAEGGELAALCENATESARAAQAALDKAVLGKLFGKGKMAARNEITEAGQHLWMFRERVAQLFTDANSAGELTATGRRRVAAAGVLLPKQAPAVGEEPGHERSVVYQTIAQAIRGGDPLAHVIKRLALTEREIKHRGSLAYISEIDKACPSSLLDRLDSPPGRAEASDVLERALLAAKDLADLVVRVADREWSGAVSATREMSQLRLALDGVRVKLVEHADAARVPGNTYAKRLSRLSDSLGPVLSGLVLRVAAAEADMPGDGGQQAYEQAQAKTVALLGEWARLVGEEGVLARPPWAGAAVTPASYTGDDELAEIKAAVLYDAREEMWQLCAPSDLAMLNTADPPHAIPFAPRLNQGFLSEALPRETAWAPSGSYAGLLRLVPLRDGVISVAWTSDQASPEVRS